MAIRHPFESPVADAGDPEEVGPNEWNDDHAIDPETITYELLQNVSATDRALGRVSPGPGTVEEFTVTAAGRALLDDPTAADQRATLGLGTAATQSTAAFEPAGAVATHAALTIVHGISAFGATLVAATNADAAGVTLGLADVATSGSAADLTGDLSPDRIVDGALPLAKLEDLAAETIVGSVAGGPPMPLSRDDVIGILGSVTVDMMHDAGDGNATDPSSPATRPMFFDVLTFSAGYSYNTGGFPIFARETVVPTGTAIVHRNGNAGNSAAADSGVNATGGTAITGGQFGAAGAGGTGGNGGGSSSAPRGFTVGAAAGAPAPAPLNPGAAGTSGGTGQGGGGGGGGASAVVAGGAGGNSGTVALYSQASGDISVMTQAVDGLPAKGSATVWTAGTGGGAGGTGQTAGGGGGGGGGGGYVVFVTGRLAGDLRIRANGGNGGNGSNGTTGNNCGGGGGGGGSGGVAIVVVGRGDTPTISANGGTGGSGGTAAGTGSAGGAGGAGGAGITKLFTPS